MPKTKLPELGETELVLMKTLWRAESMSAREIHDDLPEALEWAYTTTRSTLDRMVAKGLVTKTAWHGLYLYRAAIARPEGLAGYIRRFAARVLETEPSKVVSLFIEKESLSRDEIRRLRALVED
ncbi:MAG: BlaI/MecI/CopY family transcriptional regulator [Acidobacteria bacterium]|nr:BlaI/MecI/CopY family transcriptional regulator [Acidobacteriota bacterium]MBV9476137.1 BlaI/MecI/CopY family transcriptional regulator [Acidobacteriota bacterium]